MKDFHKSHSKDSNYNQDIQKHYLENPNLIASKGVENEADNSWKEHGLRLFDVKRSNASFEMNDVVGFVYGPFTSRFWLMRKALNTHDWANLKED